MAQKKANWLLYLIPIAVGGFFVWRLTRKPKPAIDGGKPSDGSAGGESKPPAKQLTAEQKKRTDAANKLIKAFQKSKNKELSTTYDTEYSRFIVDKDGKEVFQGMIKSKKGTLMGLKGLSVKFKVDGDGFIKAYYTKDGINYVNWFSPYPQAIV